MNKKEVLTVLDQDRLRNINLINFIQQYPLKSMQRVGDSFLIRGTSDQIWVYISSNNTSEFLEIIKLLDAEDEYFAIIEDWMLPLLIKERKILWQLSCVKLYFPNDLQLPESESKIIQLQLESADYIFKHSKYQDFTSIEYIEERIELGLALGIFMDKKIVAWLMTHDDGAMGFLHVLPEYRGRGYARDLTFKMIKLLRSMNKVPFVHIEENNRPSMNLALKTGFRKDRRIHWFQLERS